MTNQSDTTLRSIEEIIRRFAPRRSAQTAITRHTRLVEDLEIDSPRMIDIVLEIEDRFGITLEDINVQNAGTVGDLLHLIESRTTAAAD